MHEHNPERIVKCANRIWDITLDSHDKKDIALSGVNCLKEFWKSIGLPVSFFELGIKYPDIELLVKKLHENKGESIGAYLPLTEKETREIFELAL